MKAIVKTCTLVAILLAWNASVSAQSAASPSDVAAPAVPFFQQISNDYWLIIVIFSIMLITISVLAIALRKVSRAYIMLVNPHYATEEKKELQQKLEQKESSEGWWSVIDKKFLTKAVPVEKEKDILIDHPHDGIYELDNNLPPWWKYGFYITIVFAFIYMIAYHITGNGKLQLEEYEAEMRSAEMEKAERMKNAANNINEQNVVSLTDAASLEEGKITYLKFCAACHLPDGGGLVGPNLTDEFWIHGGGIKNVFRTVESGVPSKGMIAWKTQLTPKQIQQVSSYIITMSGSRPAVPKEPQGDKWTDTSAPADTTVQLSVK